MLPGYTETMKAIRLTLLALACCAPLLASAQWQWLDQSGRKVFSDTPPPASVPDNRILQQPGQRAPAADAPVAAAEPAAARPAVPVLSGKDPALEAKKKEAETAEAQKKQLEEAKIAQARAESCRRAKLAKSTLDSGVRLARTNEKGEREILDDKQREEEGKHIGSMIARHCVVAQ